MNRTDRGFQDRFGNTYLCMGNDSSAPTAAGNTCTTVPIHEGGFIDIESLPAARFFFFDRRLDTA